MSRIMLAFALLPGPAFAAALDRRFFGPAWALPFAGMLLSIALVPLLASHLWHHHHGKIAAGWEAATMLPAAIIFGPGAMPSSLTHTMMQEYIPFIALLVALYTTGGGVLLTGRWRARRAPTQHCWPSAPCWPT